MVQITTLRERAGAGMAWLLVVSVGLVVALVFGNISVFLAALIAALFGGWLVLRGQAPALASSSPVSTDTTAAPRTQRGVWMADGTLRQAQVLPVAAVDGYQTVLTIDGYALVNAEGRVVYPLSRDARAETSEPVIVTIFDQEVDTFEDAVAVD